MKSRGRPLRIVICSAQHPGTKTQCRAIAAALSKLSASVWGRVRTVECTVLIEILMNVPGLRRAFRPTVILSCGSKGERRARRFKATCPEAFWAHVEYPALHGSVPDLIFLSHHDWHQEYDRRPEFFRLSGVPHEIEGGMIEAQRPVARAELGVINEDVHVFLIGGPNRAFDFDAVAVQKIIDEIAKSATTGNYVVATTSRRTNATLVNALRKLRSDRVSVYDGQGSNPYRRYLAAGDRFFVTEDSITMCCEASATGKPVELLRLNPIPGEHLEKFRRFQRHFTDELHILGLHVGEAPARLIPDDAGAAALAVLNRLESRVVSELGRQS